MRLGWEMAPASSFVPRGVSLPCSEMIHSSSHVRPSRPPPILNRWLHTLSAQAVCCAVSLKVGTLFPKVLQTLPEPSPPIFKISGFKAKWFQEFMIFSPSHFEGRMLQRLVLPIPGLLCESLFSALPQAPPVPSPLRMATFTFAPRP